MLLVFSVVDSGIGIVADQQEWIFESFTQGDGSHTRKYGGSGLGLSLAKRLTEAMGGQLNFKSEPGRGSTFRLQVALIHDPASIGEGDPPDEADGPWVTLLRTATAICTGEVPEDQPCSAEPSEQALLAECHRLLSLCEQAVQAGRMEDVDRWTAPLKQAGARFLSHEGDDFDRFSNLVLRMAIAARNADADKAMLALDQARASLTS